MNTSKRPRVGIGVFIIRDDQVLLGKRKNAHGAGAWSAPGGHLEYQETWAECARREVWEETGLPITNIRFGAITNDIFSEEQLHYITISMVAEYVAGEPKVLEPDKFEELRWFAWENLPQPCFVPLANLKKSGFNPFDIPKSYNNS